MHIVPSVTKGVNIDRIVGDRDALQLAKQVVSEEYSVVGLVDHMELSLALMETLVPRFFTGALQVYHSIRELIQYIMYPLWEYGFIIEQ